MQHKHERKEQKIALRSKKDIAKKNYGVIVKPIYGYGCIAQLARATDS